MDINGTMTPDQLRNALVAEFRELLNRYNADFNIVDRFKGRGYNTEWALRFTSTRSGTQTAILLEKAASSS
jgi:hypothetical protein